MASSPTPTSDASEDENPYVRGGVHPNTNGYASFETKPPNYTLGGRKRTGAGYERWRSTEHDPTRPGDRKTDVYVSHHRLLAVVACYPEDEPLDAILADLHGKDVHHTTGVEWCNFGESPNFERAGLDVKDHGVHASITNAQRRAWAEDAKRAKDDANDYVASGDDRECVECGVSESSASLARVAGVEGVRCLECATRVADGGTIELV